MEKHRPLEQLDIIANFEGNQTELFLQRLNNPRIFNQIVDLWEARLRVVWQQLHVAESIKRDDAESTLDKNMRVFLSPQNREEIEVELQRRIDEVASYTPVRFERDQNADTECIPTEFILHNGERANTLQMSIVEAHEKGHLIRTYSGMYYEMLFHDGFIFSTQAIEQEVLRNNGAKIATKPKDFQDAVSQMYQYISQPSELCERMSQLKNYFGMSGGEEFTKAHLDYAREHYVADTGMDNNMTLFFECIPPDTEAEFIRLMNTAGI